MHRQLRSKMQAKSLLVLSICLLALASATLPAQAPVPPALPNISQSLSAIADQPASHIGMVFDRSMLEGARSILESQGMTAERASAALSSITYDHYRFPRPASYSPDALASITAAYHQAGWKHLVEATPNPQPKFGPDGEPRRSNATDLWLHFKGMDVDGVTVLLRGSKDMNVIQVACDLRPVELLHLSGHFGLPKVDPSVVMVPAPNNR